MHVMKSKLEVGIWPLSDLHVCFKALLKLHNWSVRETDTTNGESAFKNPQERFTRFTPYYVDKLITFSWPSNAF